MATACVNLVKRFVIASLFSLPFDGLNTVKSMARILRSQFASKRFIAGLISWFSDLATRQRSLFLQYSLISLSIPGQ